MAGHIEGILLAAGESRRMGFPKPLLWIGNETFVEHLCRAILPVVSRLIVVTGGYADRVRAAIPADSRIDAVMNPDYIRGQLSSIKAGLRAISLDADAAIVHLADHPLVRPETFDRILDAYRTSDAPIIIARCEGRRGHPVLFRRSIFDELMAAPEDVGARAVVQADPARVLYVDVDDPGVGLDLDTPADLVKAGLPPPP